jgi:hypothetical protein
MPNIPCYDSRLIAQTLFLGASVSSFNSSVGWGSQPSQCTVTLIEDTQPVNCLFNFNKNGSNTNLLESRQFAPPTGIKDGNDTDPFLPNHYYNATDTDNPPRYVTPQGDAFDITKHSLSERMVPGKVYYNYSPYTYTNRKTNEENRTATPSRYWFNGDPGFFGKTTRIKYDNTYIKGQTGLTKGYDIIDTPVHFKVGDFSFGGLVQSWNKSINNGGTQYSVVINSMQSLLSSCYLILDKFSGSIFSKYSDGSTYGSPKNYTGMAGVTYGGNITEGNIPNVFNVYGFLESMGYDNFGASKINENGISANKIVDALTVLTSTCNDQNIMGAGTLLNPILNRSDWATKNAYSPFGRIISKCMQEYDTYNQITTNFTKFGVIPPSLNINESNISNRCQFLLDLSELPRTPDDFRIQGPVISIIDLINTIAEQTGHDFTVDLMPIVHTNNIIYNVIKVKTISRLKQPRTNLIENAIKEFQCANFPISSLTVGKEKNETHARSVIVGGQQQRLYQTKSYRLAYSQTNYIFNPQTYKFVDYMKLGTMDPSIEGPNARNSPFPGQKQFHHGKIKFPNFLSTRNIDLSTHINPVYGPILDDDDEIQNIIEGLKFNKNDEEWSDHLQTGGVSAAKALGNYKKTTIVKQEASDTPTWGSEQANTQRFFPLYKDVISPFFGYVQEEEITINTDGKNNDFKKVRPVWFDTWTGQIVIVMRLSELPIISVPLNRVSFSADTTANVPPYSADFGDYFILTESEIRAAIAGFDNFLVYSLSKAYKPDLIEMLRRAHVNNTKSILMREGYGPRQAELDALNLHNWYWQLQATNVAGYFNQPTPILPDKSDGGGNIPENVIKDLQIIHNFVNEMAKYYGKKYMVTAQGLQSYRDEAYADLTISTQVGEAYIFNGGGSFRYNYTPTNDGAWEEYGNIIDDTIAVGGPYWYNLTDDSGKIKPLLGYNANDYFDYIRYSLCKMTQAHANEAKTDKANPYWSFDTWKELLDARDTVCAAANFTFPSLDFSSLNSTDYSLINVVGSTDTIASSLNLPNVTPAPLSDVPSQAFDSYGKPLVDNNGVGLLKKKLYIPTSVQESFIYLDPVNLIGPKILIDSPGVFLNTSSSQYAKDPNRTVIANTSIEDLIIYLKSVQYAHWDYEWIKYQLHWISPVMGDESFLMGNTASSANASSSHVEISAKAAHPFFAAIPIKSNQFTYGPWTNYPYLQHLSDPQSIFPNGKSIETSTNATNDLICTSTDVITNNEAAKRAIDNWIVPTNIEINDDFVPWNYGGMSFLDQAALNEIQTKINYQNILETAQLDMVGLPLFNLGGNFNFANINSNSSNILIKSTEYIYTDVKNASATTPPNVSSDFALPAVNISNDDTQIVTYNCFGIDSSTLYNTVGPIITNIQVNIGPQGITTTYSFRTYTKKLGLFNKENSDRLKFMFTENQKRNKQLANISQQSLNMFSSQIRFLEEKRLNTASFGINDQETKLFGWSPSLVLIGQAIPYIEQPKRDPQYVEDFSLFTAVNEFNTRPNEVQSWKIPTGKDPGTKSTLVTPTSAEDSIKKLNGTLRLKTSVSLFERKEVDSQLNKDYGLQSAMSLDGIFSPISYYPTLKNSTYNFSVYDTTRCPFCKGTKKRTIEYATYFNNTRGTTSREVYCDKCSGLEDKLNAKLKVLSDSSVSSEALPPYIITSGNDFDTLLKFSNGSSSSSTTTIPINLISLNPIVIPHGEFKNSNTQSDDRKRHSIEIVSRGSVPPNQYKHSLEISRNINKNVQGYNVDYLSEDIVLKSIVDTRERTDSRLYETNQRFMGLRGPLTMHSWGYDQEGYPVPNAADEPYQLDDYLRPKRFKKIISVNTASSGLYSNLNFGDSFKIPENTPSVSGSASVPELYLWKEDEEPPMKYWKQGHATSGSTYNYVKTFNNELLPLIGEINYITLTAEEIKSQFPDKDPVENTIEVIEIKPKTVSDDSYVFKVSIYDDMTDPGGFDPDIYKGNVISKSQIWTANQSSSNSNISNTTPSFTTASNLGRWSEKTKSNKFHLNWAERPDLWPVGPIDLRWDAARKIWSMPNNSTSYKFVYITLEEDLIKEDDYDETYPARGFLDELEYSKEPLPYGYRRLVYVKDKTGYTAPRGVKLLCRYDVDSGFYEPISKPSIMTIGKIDSGNKAVIEMTYVQGRKKGEIPTMLVTFDNSKFNLSYTQGKNGMFTYLAGQWILTNVQQ